MQTAPKAQAVAEEKKPEPKPAQPEHKDEPKPAQAQAPAAKPAEAEKPKEESKIFTLKSEKKLAPKVNVLGKIDLDSLNQSTRPKKKPRKSAARSARRRPCRLIPTERRNARA